MTNVRRPFHLQLQRPASSQAIQASSCNSPKALSPTGDSLPSQIVPYLFVGDQGQTNRETINRLNISYILSLGHLPIISVPPPGGQTTATTPGATPTTPTSPVKILMPSQDCSKDFKIRITSINSINSCGAGGGGGATAAVVVGGGGGGNINDSQHNNSANNNNLINCGANVISNTSNNNNNIVDQFDENKAVKPIRSIRCKCINITDHSDQILSKFFDEAHAFIDEARRKKCNILVHCLAGISRSPTFAIAYLMRLRSLHWRDAYDLVKRCRPQIDPNLSFMSQLMTYNRTLLANGRTLTPSNSDNGSKFCDDELDSSNKF